MEIFFKLSKGLRSFIPIHLHFYFQGLYPESHGIVFNTFYAADLRRFFSIKRSLYPPFYKGEPVRMG